MGQVDRFSVSLDTELLAAFDRYIAGRGYGNRSEAVRDLIRDMLTADRIRRDDEPVTLVLSMLLDLRMGETDSRINKIAGANAGIVTASWHIPVDSQAHIVILAMRGLSGSVHDVAGEIQALRGVLHARMALLPATTAIQSDGP